MIIDNFEAGGHKIVINQVLRPLKALLASIIYPDNHTHFVLDIGASDGLDQNNGLFFFMQGWPGLCLDADPQAFQRWLRFYPQHLPWVKGQCLNVTPENILEVLRAQQVPQFPSLLSLDIDGFDYPVLETLLSSYQPLVICAEINESIPVPISFYVHYSEAYRYTGSHFFGMSLSALHDLALSQGYVLVDLSYNNALLVKEECYPEHWQRPTLTEVYNKYVLGPRRAWNAPLFSLENMNSEQALAFLQHYFAEHVDFSLSISQSCTRSKP